MMLPLKSTMAAAGASSAAIPVPAAEDALIGQIVTDSSDDERFEVIRRATPAESRGMRGTLYKVKRVSNNRMQPSLWDEHYLRSKVLGLSRAQYTRSIDDDESGFDEEEEE